MKRGVTKLMERLLFADLIKWKEKKNRKPLIIQGARQVGKTWIMKEFGKRCFQTVIYINFDNNPRMKNVFEEDFDVKRIISALKIEHGEKFTSDNTLLIFDEIQEVPKALSALKYFYEDAPEYAIIAAGSLLGIALHQGTSFPVGKVDFLHLYPLNFKEFLMALGQDLMAELLTEQDEKLISSFSGKYIDYLKKYYYVGGMPEAVQCFVDNDDYFEVRKIQKNLLKYYEEDFSKHAPKETVPRIQMVWNSIPGQLAKQNRKFIYGMIREGARAKDFELAIQWLMDCGLIHKSYRIKKPDIPLKAYVEINSFKMFLSDVGLLAAMGDLPVKVLLEGNRIFEEFKGALTEQYVAQELVSYGKDLFYYTTENSSGEIDFVIQQSIYCIPIEVKAEENLKAKSLRAFCDKYRPEIAIRSSMSNFKEQEWMKNVPLYALADQIKNIL